MVTQIALHKRQGKQTFFLNIFATANGSKQMPYIDQIAYFNLLVLISNGYADHQKKIDL